MRWHLYIEADPISLGSPTSCHCNPASWETRTCYSTSSIPWLVMAWLCNEPGHGTDIVSLNYSSFGMRKVESSVALWFISHTSKRVIMVVWVLFVSIPRAHFMKDFFYHKSKNMIRWKFNSVLIQVVFKWLLWNFVHGTTAVLSLHVLNFGVIWFQTKELTKTKFQ